MLYDIGSYAYHNAQGNFEAAKTDQQAFYGDALGAAIPGVTGLGLGVRIAKSGEKVYDAGKAFTRAQKRDILEANRLKNGGVLRSDMSGKELVKAQQSQKGIRPPTNEAQIDHVIPKSKGGTNSPSNSQVLSREENIRKSNN